MSTRGTAIVVGAGIAGLATGCALARIGWHVRLLERSPSIDAVGAGLAVAPNALRALDALGLGDKVRSFAVEGSGGIRRADGRWMLRTDMAEVRRRFGDSLVVMRRSMLIDVLLDALPTEALHLGVEVDSVDPGDDHTPARVRTRHTDRNSGDTEYDADLVVGADGIWSPTRQALFPNAAPVYSGFTGWRLVTSAFPGPRPDAAESWGRGACTGVMPLSDNSVYAYLVRQSPVGLNSPDGERAELLRRFSDWAEPLPTLLAASQESDIIRGDLHHLSPPLPTYHQGRAALVGDAAHAMLPFLGQGACQALEDAVELASALRRSTSGGVARGLSNYSAARVPRANGVVTASATAARLQGDSRILAALRDSALSTVARVRPGLFYRQLGRTIDWNAPTLVD